MKKILSVILVTGLCFLFLTGCKTGVSTTSSATQKGNIIHPLPDTLDINALDNCTVAVSFEKEDINVDEDGKITMNATVYTYELYDMVDIASLKENDVIVRRNEEVKVEKLERLESGLVRINDGEENGGFDLISNDGTVYYETGMSDLKAYYESGTVKLPVSEKFEYVDESDLDAEPKHYSIDDLMAETEYNFTPNNTSVVIENAVVIKMNKVYMP